MDAIPFDLNLQFLRAIVEKRAAFGPFWHRRAIPGRSATIPGMDFIRIVAGRP